MKTISQAVNTYKSKTIKPVWCPGCGDYGVLAALDKTFKALEFKPEDIAIVSGIGCSGRFSHYFNSYSLHGTHGRALPTATGLKTARPDLHVITIGGDGDGLSIGGGHIAHAARKNVDLTYIILDNNVYGMTKGQSSPTTPVGYNTKTAPYGVYEESLNPIAMFLSYNISYIARTTSTDMKAMHSILTEAIEHKGFSMVYIMSPCVTYSVLPYSKLKEIVEPLPEDHDTSDKLSAFKYAYSDEHMYTGVFYKEEKTSLDERLKEVFNIANISKTTSEIMAEFK